MRYSVKWSKKAKNVQLVDIWLQAADRPAVTRAVHEVEVLLSYQAETLGESRNKIAESCSIHQSSCIFASIRLPKP
jgi:hypothetical protein